MAPSTPLVKSGETLHTVSVEEKRSKRIFIDGREYERLEDVPEALRAQVEQQAQGLDAVKRDVSTGRRSVRLSGRAGSTGQGGSGNSFLVIAGIGVVLLILLLYVIGS